MELADYKNTFEKLNEDITALDHALVQTQEHLAKLIQQRDSLVQAYNALAPMLGEEPLKVQNAVKASIEAISAASISSAVKILLDENMTESFTAAQMRDRLAQRGWDWSSYVNPLATVHTVLTRMAKAGHAKEDTKNNPDGARSFYSTKRGLLTGLAALAIGSPVLPEIRTQVPPEIRRK